MVTTYIPKKSFFAPTRIQKIAKDILKECSKDKEKALETYDYFKDLINRGDEEVAAELAKCLKLSQDATTSQTKILELMLKMSQTEMKIEPPKKDKVNFADLKKKKNDND